MKTLAQQASGLRTHLPMGLFNEQPDLQEAYEYATSVAVSGRGSPSIVDQAGVMVFAKTIRMIAEADNRRLFEIPPMQTLKILSIHATIEGAVAKAKPDLSYNQEEADRVIRRLSPHVHEAYVTDGGIYRVYECDIRAFGKFEPFSACVHDTPFSVVAIDREKMVINITPPLIKKSPEGRALVRALGLTVM